MRPKRRIPEINSSASADIAFLLLTFFLIISSMDSNRGIFRRLNPDVSENGYTQKTDIEKRNLISIDITGQDQILYNQSPIVLDSLKAKVKFFIENPENSDKLPAKEVIDIPNLGKISTAQKYVISLGISRNANYQTYISLQNELTAVYNELREELSIKLFKQPFSKIGIEQQNAIREVYPQRISEHEIKEEGGPDE